jgi:hypothetical protein
MTTLSCNAIQPQSLSKTVYKHELDQVPAVPAHFTSAYLDVSVKVTNSLPDNICSE